MMAKKNYSFLISDELDSGLKALKDRDGMPEAEAIRRALAQFLQEKGVLAKPKASKRKKVSIGRRKP